MLIKKTIRIIIFSSILVILFVFLASVYSRYTEYNLHKSELKRSSSIEAMVKDCGTSGNWRECYGSRFAAVVKKEGVKAAQEELHELQEIDEKTRDCHIIAHRMMDAAVEKSKGDWKEYVQVINPSECNYGFVHGLLEGASEYDRSFKLDPATISQICDLMQKETGAAGADQGCAHAMGHLLMAEACGEVDPAVLICKNLEDKLQFQCFAGVFMENFTQDNISSHCGVPKKPTDDNLISNQELLCQSYSSEVARACWQETSHLYGYKWPGDIEKIFEACGKAVEKDFVAACYTHAAATLALNSNDPQYLSTICDPFKNTEYYPGCIRTVTISLLGASLSYAGRAASFCSAIDSGSKDYCYSKIVEYAHTRSSGDQAKICLVLPTMYKNRCE